MRLIVRFFLLLTAFTKRIGICGNTGFITGSIVGLLLTILNFVHNGTLVLDQAEKWKIALLLAAFAWIVILFMLCIISKIVFSSVALPSLFNCIVTSILTVFISAYLNAFDYAWLIGMIIGVLVGLLLCRLNSILKNLNV